MKYDDKISQNRLSQSLSFFFIQSDSITRINLWFLRRDFLFFYVHADRLFTSRHIKWITLKVFRYKCKFVYTFTRRIHRRDIKCATNNSLISRSRIRRNVGIACLYAGEVYSVCVSQTRNFYRWTHFTSSCPSVCHSKVRNVWCIRREESSNVDAGPIVMIGCLFNVRITARDSRTYYFESARHACVYRTYIYVYMNTRIYLSSPRSLLVGSLCKSSERKRIVPPLLAD